MKFCMQLSMLEFVWREPTLKQGLPEARLPSNVIVPFIIYGNYRIYYLLKTPGHLFCRIFRILDLADCIPVCIFILILFVNGY